MIGKIKNKSYLASFAIPAYAATDLTTELKTELPEGSAFSGIAGLTFGQILGWLMSMVFIITSLIFFFVLVGGGIKWITSGGDEKKVAAARASITSGMVGLAIVFAAWAIMRLLGAVFGVDFFQLAVPALVPPKV